MKITHDDKPRTRIGLVVHESEIRDGEIYDDGHGEFANCREMPAADREAIIAWVRGGALRGDVWE